MRKYYSVCKNNFLMFDVKILGKEEEEEEKKTTSMNIITSVSYSLNLSPVNALTNETATGNH